MNITPAAGLPTPNTTWVRPLESRQRVHVDATVASSVRVMLMPAVLPASRGSLGPLASKASTRRQIRPAHANGGSSNDEDIPRVLSVLGLSGVGVLDEDVGRRLRLPAMKGLALGSGHPHRVLVWPAVAAHRDRSIIALLAVLNHVDERFEHVVSGGAEDFHLHHHGLVSLH